MIQRRLALAVVAAAVAFTLASCGAAPRPNRVIVLGLDGLDPQALDLMMSEGLMPNFARLRQDGAYGKLRAADPMLSPVLWTTIATGKDPSHHGIGHFVAAESEKGEKLPVTSTMRRVEAVWNIASDAGRRVATVGWWATWPPEAVNGVVVSDHTCYHFLFDRGETGGPQSEVTYPAELVDEIRPLIRRPGDIGHEEARRFVDVPPAYFDRNFDFADEISHLRWAVATADSYRNIGLKLWRGRQPDLLMVYIEGTDSISHLFGHLFRARDLAGELAEQQRRFGNAAEEIYRYADDLLGRYLAVMDEDTTLLVMSDHGFKLGELHDDPSRTRDLRRISELYHREYGILYMYGNDVKRHVRINGATQLDITPTLLALLGLDVARDMPGRVLVEALEIAAPERPIDSYEREGRRMGTATGDAAVDDRIKAHLKSLGYLEDDDTVSPEGDRNLAAIHFAAGRHREAAEIYARLIQSDPENASLHASFAGCLGAMGRYEEALEPLGKSLELSPLNIEAYHNRAVIHERLGDIEAAIADYRTAVSYRPDYEPSVRALVRLTGFSDVRSPQTPAEEEAAMLAGRAKNAAVRGAYPEAMELLDQAEEVAPEYVVVLQFKANVAYLVGDLDEAQKALEKALEIEPDNALFKNNLEQIKAKRAGTDR
jgi:predicted AlkP superfamily phosphohydrolase/phosphomutase/Tfp pilus assembly protein PilF